MNSSNRLTREQAVRGYQGPVALRARDIADLTVASGYPCISVLLPTEPGPHLAGPDAQRLRELVAEVGDRLRESGVLSPEPLMRKLEEQSRLAAGQPTGCGLAIYVSLALARTFRLPQTVTARVVVEPTFATRPLVAALHRMPPHAVLVLHVTCAHLYAAADGGLRPAGQVDPFAGGGNVRLPRPGDPGAETAREELTESYLRAVDRMLGGYRADHPSPLVLVGEPDLLEAFASISRHLERLAGRLASTDHLTALDLALASAEAVEGYLRTRRQDALGQLESAFNGRPGDVASGIDGCWRALGSRRPAMLLVEENFVCPGASAQARTDAGHPAAPSHTEVHDLVDDLMEQVILRGGQLALVRDGDLAAHGRIALISRR